MFSRLMVIDSRRTKKIAYILFQVLVSLSLLMVYILMLYEYIYIYIYNSNFTEQEKNMCFLLSLLC